MAVASENANPQCHQRWLDNPCMKKMEVEFAGKIIEPLLLIFSSTPCLMVSGITVYHLKFSPPRCESWCWYIYLQNWVMFWVNVGTLWLCQNSYWKWPFIVDFPMKNGGSFHSYVSLPEGKYSSTMEHLGTCWPPGPPFSALPSDRFPWRCPRPQTRYPNWVNRPGARVSQVRWLLGRSLVGGRYPLVNIQKAMENCPFIHGFPIKNCVFL